LGGTARHFKRTGARNKGGKKKEVKGGTGAKGGWPQDFSEKGKKVSAKTRLGKGGKRERPRRFHER